MFANLLNQCSYTINHLKSYLLSLKVTILLVLGSRLNLNYIKSSCPCMFCWSDMVSDTMYFYDLEMCWAVLFCRLLFYCFICMMKCGIRRNKKCTFIASIDCKYQCWYSENGEPYSIFIRRIEIYTLFSGLLCEFLLHLSIYDITY